MRMEEESKRDHEDSGPSPEKIMRMEDAASYINSNESKINTLAQFQSESGEAAGPPIELPLALARDKLQQILNVLLNQNESIPYSFFVNEKEVTTSLNGVIDSSTSEEKVMTILYQPQAVFRVRAVTRCTSSLPGHAEAVLSASFSPDGQHLASGSGDTTVRFWDINTETPHFVCKGHRHWVLVTAWSPDGERLASGCKSGQIFIWDPTTGKQLGRALTGHKQWVTSLCWEPLHLTASGESTRLASAGKDGDVRIWNTKLGSCEKVLTNHLQSVTALRWSGEDLLYSASQDRTIKVWRASDGVMCRTLQGHGHWVNTLALNTDYALRTGAFDPQSLMKERPEITAVEKRRTCAEKRYKEALAAAGGVERLASGSDDFTLFLWEPAKERKPIERMTGHQQLVNDVKFSPDTRIIASASFDKSIRLWSGLNGKFIGVLRGHVGGVYQIAWSADSRLLVSGSKDSTLKVWNVSTKKIEMDLPGHADEVFTVDWSPDGQRVVSGGKDKILKLWRR
ncbi:notchless protein homolog 1 isoform X1 [Procambarus clarkii]|uniref:notchless protein homolog 1 isoform X1 n=2 Tax=Procambarus clarkii TaxID=6728 RepID=UPI001E675346|nr:notchless protein homolog 1-like [Procambarus clarkii]